MNLFYSLMRPSRTSLWQHQLFFFFFSSWLEMFFVTESNEIICIKKGEGNSINQIKILPHNNESLRFYFGFSNFLPWLINMKTPLNSRMENRSIAFCVTKSRKPHNTQVARGHRAERSLLGSSRPPLNTSP